MARKFYRRKEKKEMKRRRSRERRTLEGKTEARTIEESIVSIPERNRYCVEGEKRDERIYEKLKVGIGRSISGRNEKRSLSRVYREKIEEARLELSRFLSTLPSTSRTIDSASITRNPRLTSRLRLTRQPHKEK